jgi:hypothetical protein
MSEVGALIVKLQAETAQFREDMGKVKKDLADLKGTSSETGDAMDASMTKARGGLMLVEESIGVRLPRHLNTLLAEIPGVGAAFAMMLPIAGVVVGIEVVGKLIERQRALAEAISKAGAEATAAAVKQSDQTKQLDLTNLKLDDQIAKLEHKPAHNYMKEAILETSIAVDDLAAKYSSDFQAMNKAIEGQLGPWERLKRGVVDAFSGVGQGKGYGTTTNALFEVQNQLDAVEAARRKLAETPAGSEAEKTAQQGLISALNAQKKALDDLKPKYQGNSEMLLSIGTAATSTANEVKNLNQVLENGKKRETVASDEQKEANLEPLKRAAELEHTAAAGAIAHANAIKAQTISLAEMALAQKEADSKLSPAEKLSAELTAIATERDATVNAVTAEAAAKEAAYKKARAAEGDPAKRAELDKAWSNEQIALADKVANANIDAEKRRSDAERSAAAESLRLAEELNQSKTKLALATEKREESIKLDSVKKDEDANERLNKLGLETQQQYLARKIELIRQEEKIKEEALAHEIEAEAANAAKAGHLGDTAKQNEALARKIQLQAQLNTLTKQYASELSATHTEAEKLNSSWGNYFTHMMAETMDLSTKIRVNLQSSITQFTDNFANSMAKCIVENKSLGQAVKKEAEQMLESMISMLVRWLEQWIITHTLANVFQKTTDQTGKASAAQLAGANMVASWSAAPWPIDAMAPAMGAQAFAAAMSFEIGGKIPGSNGPVPIIGHAGETVVTKALTDRVERAESFGGEKAGSTVHMHYAPQIHAVDATGVDAMLAQHSAIFQRHIVNVLRKCNR